MSRRKVEKPTFSLTRRKGRPNHYIQFCVDRKPQRISTGTEDKEAAQKYLAEFEAAYDIPLIEGCLLIEAVLDQYLVHKKKAYDKKDNGHNDWINLKHSFKTIYEHFGHLEAEANNFPDHTVEKYIANDFEKGLSTGTTRRRLAHLTASLNYSAKQKWGVNKVPYIELPPEPEPKDTVLTPEQVKLLLECTVEPHTKLFMLLALHTLSRHTAITSLSWEQVDFKTGLIRFNPRDRKQTKKKRVHARMNKTLRKALEEAYDIRETDWVIEYDRKPVRNCKKSMQRSMERAQDIDPTFPHTTAHTLRHTGASLLAANPKITLGEIAALLGDSIETTIKIYVHLQPDYLRNATDALDGIY